MMSNRLSKNLEKGVSATVVTSLASIAVWLLNRYVTDMPTEISAASVIVLSAAIAAAANWLKHGPMHLPFRR
jgi:hypothetical protein